jgi:hypothetical protein
MVAAVCDPGDVMARVAAVAVMGSAMPVKWRTDRGQRLPRCDSALVSSQATAFLYLNQPGLPGNSTTDTACSTSTVVLVLASSTGTTG